MSQHDNERVQKMIPRGDRVHRMVPDGESVIEHGQKPSEDIRPPKPPKAVKDGGVGVAKKR